MILGCELELASLCISSRLSCPATSNESLPISTPISATALLSLCDMACSLTLAPPGQLRLLRGWRTAGPSNSAHKETRSSALPQSRSDSRYGTLICYRFGQSQNRPGIVRHSQMPTAIDERLLSAVQDQDIGAAEKCLADGASPNAQRVTETHDDSFHEEHTVIDCRRDCGPFH